ncbi:MAG TPA: Crp/Fnr family transcriptional regulator [Anaerolineaceae bacterium]|nr:Crp/Fnr family transcriptional regulator [Anaerolineaceae bacterium]HPN51653.1 Crp/Fnr family transcriptional regulator [Anaerolineaceae bacterium]
MQNAFLIFENLCPSWPSALHLGIRRRIPRGSEIFEPEAQTKGIFFITEGMVEIYLNTLQGPEQTLYFVGSKCIFGEVSCFVSGETSEASVRAREDCTLYFFSLETLQGPIARQFPNLLLELVQAAAYKIRGYSVLLHDSRENDQTVRVVKMILNLISYKGLKPGKDEKRVILKPGMTQNDVAHLLGVHRVTVTKVIKTLKDKGIIKQFTRNKLEILDFPSLCRIVENAAAKN